MADSKSLRGCFSNVMSACVGQNDVSGEQFWMKWTAAGGDVEQYMKDSMPDYSVTASLLITMTFPYAIDVPQHVLDHSSTLAFAFVSCMTAATILNVLVILTTMTVKQQYCCTIDDETAAKYAAHYGFIIPVLQTSMILIVLLFTAAMAMSLTTIDLSHDYDETKVFYAVVFAVSGLVVLGALYLMFTIPRWNQNDNYYPKVEEHARRARMFQDSHVALPSLKDVVSAAVGEVDCGAVMKLLASEGFTSVEDLVYFMQAHAPKDDTDRTGPYAATLHELKIKPLHALQIADRIGVELFKTYEHPAPSVVMSI